MSELLSQFLCPYLQHFFGNEVLPTTNLYDVFLLYSYDPIKGSAFISI